jgi:hypothetical protein
MRPTDPLPEVTIKTDEMLTEVDRRSGKPRIRHGISFKLFLDEKLPQARPLRAERREVDTLSAKQRIDKGKGVVDRRCVLENLGLLTSRTKLASTIGIRISVAPDAASSSQRRAIRWCGWSLREAEARTLTSGVIAQCCQHCLVAQRIDASG